MMYFVDGPVVTGGTIVAGFGVGVTGAGVGGRST